MNLPRFHSCTWSDDEETGQTQPDLHGPMRELPGSLAEKELRLWVTYPAVKPVKRKGNRSESRLRAVKLWAVVIVVAVRQTGAFNYEVVLKRIFKRDDRTIKVWVSNDPDDQSDDAVVFGVVSPPAALLTSLEHYLSQTVAKRVYDAIAQTWPCGDTSVAGSSPVRLPTQLCCEGAATALLCGPAVSEEGCHA